MDEVKEPVHHAEPPVVKEQATGTDELVAVVPAVPAALAAARRRLRRWLDVLGWPEPETDDLLLAVNEALSNVVDHAYPPGSPGSATMHAWLTVPAGKQERRVVITVIDRGRWAAHHPDSPALSLRGRGLTMMRACVSELHVQPSAAGTTVIMVSAAVPSGHAGARASSVVE